MTVLARSVQRLQTKSPVPALPPAGCVTLGQSLYCLNENVLICKSGVLSPPLQHHMGVLVINVASEPLFVFLGGEFLMELLGLLLLLLLQQLSAAPAPAAGSAEMGLSAPHARVIRDGKESVIDAADLVPGDIIKLEAGDFVPADARLLTSTSLPHRFLLLAKAGLGDPSGQPRRRGLCWPLPRGPCLLVLSVHSSLLCSSCCVVQPRARRPLVVDRISFLSLL